MFIDVINHPIITGFKILAECSSKIEVVCDEGRLFVKLPEKVTITEDKYTVLKAMGWRRNGSGDFFIDDDFYADIREKYVQGLFIE